MAEVMVSLVCQECGSPFSTKATFLTRPNRGRFCARACQLIDAQRTRWKRYHDTVEQWFWGRMDRTGGEDACWVWKGRKWRHGYGRLMWHGSLIAAHRLAAILVHGRPPTPDHFACHRCDNPPCCNPRHLWWGTHQENTDDMHAKGRGRGGPNSPALRARAAMSKAEG